MGRIVSIVLLCLALSGSALSLNNSGLISPARAWTHGVASGGGTFAFTFNELTTAAGASTVTITLQSYTSGATAVIVGLIVDSSSAATTTASMSVSGTSCSEVSGTYEANTGSNGYTDIWQCPSVPGSSGSVVIAFSGGTPAGYYNAVAVALYSLTTTHSTASGSGVGNTGAGMSATTTSFNATAGGGGIAITDVTNGDFSSFTNAGTDGTAPATNAAAGHLTASGASTTVTSNSSITGQEIIVSAAAWGP